jgi:hypothetical protein
VDVWPIGIVLFQIFHCLSTKDLFTKCVDSIPGFGQPGQQFPDDFFIQALNISFKIEPLLMNLLKKMLVYEENRLSSECLLHHPTVQSFSRDVDANSQYQNGYVKSNTFHFSLSFIVILIN